MGVYEYMNNTNYNIKNSITSDELKHFRTTLGLSQVAFAKMLGVSRPTIERMETSDKKISGPIAVLVDMLSENMELFQERVIPPKIYPLRMWYMYNDKKCTLIEVDDMNRKIHIQNYTSRIMYMAFGANQKPSYEDYSEFLKSRCFPETRDKMKIQLDALGIPFYDPMMIIEKTKGRMAEDDFWILIEK